MFKVPCAWHNTAMILILIWDVAVLVAFMWAIFGQGYSGWWFIVMFILFVRGRHVHDEHCQPKCRIKE